MNIEQAAELLEWMGYECDGDRWCNFKVDPSYTFVIHNLREFALTELSRNEEVMERVVGWLNENVDSPIQLRRSYGNSGKYADYADESDDGVPSYENKDLIEWAIRAGIGKQIMGEG